MAMARGLGMTERGAYRAIAAMRRAVCPDLPGAMSGDCEADATYVGGEWADKRVHIRAKGTKRGRGTSKQCVFGVVRRGGKVRTWSVPGERRAEVEPPVLSAVTPGSRMFADECGAYGRLDEIGPRHETANHSAGGYVRGEARTQTPDGYWGLLRNFLAAKGGVQPGNLMRFVGGHSWRYNNRGLSRKEQALKIYALLVKFGGI
jgi:hypothetical protein